MPVRPARKALSFALLSAVVLLAAACSSSGQIPEANSVESLGEALKAAGMRVDGPRQNDFLSASYFSVPGVQYTASGETVLVYQFETEAETEAQRQLVSPDGWGIGSKYIQWIVGPNYYQNGRMIVIYDGEASLVKDTLAAAMGEPFASSERV